jgi:xylulose-5-phosphate/fructose-6-phosphate phosphoketolase
MSDTLFAELFTDTVDGLRLPRFRRNPPARARPPARRTIPCPRLIEHGTTTTPFDMTVKNKVSRFHLVMDAINNASDARWLD